MYVEEPFSLQIQNSNVRLMELISSFTCSRPHHQTIKTLNEVEYVFIFTNVLLTMYLMKYSFQINILVFLIFVWLSVACVCLCVSGFIHIYFFLFYSIMYTCCYSLLSIFAYSKLSDILILKCLVRQQCKNFNSQYSQLLRTVCNVVLVMFYVPTFDVVRLID